MQIIYTEQIFHIRISFKLIIALDSIYYNIYKLIFIINNIITRKLVSKKIILCNRYLECII